MNVRSADRCYPRMLCTMHTDALQRLLGKPTLELLKQVLGFDPYTTESADYGPVMSPGGHVEYVEGAPPHHTPAYEVRIPTPASRVPPAVAEDTPDLDALEIAISVAQLIRAAVAGAAELTSEEIATPEALLQVVKNDLEKLK